uniref:Rhomboid-6, isoform C n=1 Tax=Drosophila melanogaster TaxID=7227 RepID=X2J9K6_DROME|nr:rhomboid-6, isoform C [Drosophila melanogaster]AHN54386.1 rhomboid-6, isoform C [Drosophila melanogaster]|eukprot:NP_001285872.1 rhomboid-6, isoform C [Drosophila melanogaster]
MSAQVESNGASESNNNCVKDVRLLLLPENSTDSDGNPASVAFSAESHKKFIDDLTRTIDVGHVRRKRLWRVPWFILLMSFVQISLHWIASECMQKVLIFKPEWNVEYWRLLTYMLLHSDYWHLSLNICFQVSAWKWSRVTGVWPWSIWWVASLVRWPMPGCSPISI